MRGLRWSLALAWKLATTDVRLQYRRSTLGPLWLTLTLLAQISVIGLLFANILNEPARGYLLYLGTGLVTWQFLVTTVNESAVAFVSSSVLIKQVALPPTVYVYRVVMRNFIIFFHNVLAVVPFLILSGSFSALSILSSLGGVVLLAWNLGWAAVLIAVISARYRDLPALVSGLLVLAFYVTPILWNPAQLNSDLILQAVQLNPLSHMISLVRDPLLGLGLPLNSLFIVLLMGLAGTLLAQLMVRFNEHKVPFWV